MDGRLRWRGRDWTLWKLRLKAVLRLRAGLDVIRHFMAGGGWKRNGVVAFGCCSGDIRPTLAERRKRGSVEEIRRVRLPVVFSHFRRGNLFTRGHRAACRDRTGSFRKAPADKQLPIHVTGC